MCHAIKHGHPGRILCMMKFWTPMFYAGGGYNYAHELMELLHNYHHDWPQDTADVLFAGMLVNTTGGENSFLEGDLDCEHLNRKIKGRTNEPNVTPEVLAKVTPALGHMRHAANNCTLILESKKSINIMLMYAKRKTLKFLFNISLKRTFSDLHWIDIQNMQL